MGILSLHLAIPAAAMAVILLLPRTAERAIRWVALIGSLAAFGATVAMWLGFDSRPGDFQFIEMRPWIGSLGVSYHIGIDGIALLLVALTTFTMPIAIGSSWASITTRTKEYFALLMLLEAGMIGVFVSLDTVLFYVFWEVILIPMYFLIGVWGGKNRIYAALKFFLFTMAGSLVMLVGIIWLGFSGGAGFVSDFTRLAQTSPHLAASIQGWLFLAFAASFCIKVPLVPLHTWLPDAHTEAPTAGSVILAGVLLKMGTFGLIRYNLMLFPTAAHDYAPWLAVLGIVGIIYGALVSLVQPDLKRLIAYSSVAHLGFVVLGISALSTEAIQGAVIQMVNHGLSTGMLFLLVGMIYDRRHTRQIADFGGLARTMPVYATFFALALLASVGLPGLNGFVGEYLILIGTFKSAVLHSWAYAIIASTGVVFAACYLLWMYQRVFFGPITHEENRHVADLNRREIAMLIPVLLFIVWIGVYPVTFLSRSEATVAGLADKPAGALRMSGSAEPLTPARQRGSVLMPGGVAPIGGAEGLPRQGMRPQPPQPPMPPGGGQMPQGGLPPSTMPQGGMPPPGGMPRRAMPNPPPGMPPLPEPTPPRMPTRPR